MFQQLELPGDRYHAVAIARDRVAHFSPDDKAAALKSISEILDAWKAAQADDDGMVEVPELSGGLLATPRAKRVPVDSVEPHECAGPFIYCPSDLWLSLWSEQYPPVIDASEKITLDVVLALLLERDAITMPSQSVASAVHYIWIAVWSAVLVYREELQPADGRVNVEIDRATAGRILQAAKNDTQISAKQWARDKHFKLIADEYGQYARLGPTERGKYLYGEYAKLPGAKWKRVRGGEQIALKPSEDSFVDYVREFERERKASRE